MVCPIMIPLFTVFHSYQWLPTGAGFLPSTVCVFNYICRYIFVKFDLVFWMQQYVETPRWRITPKQCYFSCRFWPQIKLPTVASLAKLRSKVAKPQWFARGIVLQIWNATKSEASSPEPLWVMLCFLPPQFRRHARHVFAGYLADLFVVSICCSVSCFPLWHS